MALTEAVGLRYGTGYPDGLRGMSIALAARIVLVCDAFHAMSSERPYRAALSAEEAVAELEANASKQFDPLVVDALPAVRAGEDEAPASAKLAALG